MQLQVKDLTLGRRDYDASTDKPISAVGLSMWLKTALEKVPKSLRDEAFVEVGTDEDGEKVSFTVAVYRPATDEEVAHMLKKHSDTEILAMQLSILRAQQKYRGPEQEIMELLQACRGKAQRRLTQEKGGEHARPQGRRKTAP